MNKLLHIVLELFNQDNETMSLQRKYLLELLNKGTSDSTIEKKEKMIFLLNSLIDDQKDGKPPIANI